MSSGGDPSAGSRHGRHRRGWVNSAWTPAMRPTEAGRLPTHARVAWATPPAAGDTSPEPHRREPAYEDPETPRGLRKFDLGIVPASVTPPRSWRRAAWFAVGTSAVVLCGLAVAAARLVGAPSGDTIDALPTFPTQELGPLLVDDTTPAAPSVHTRTGSLSPSAHPDTARRTDDAAPPAPAHPGGPGAPGGDPTDPTDPTGTSTEPTPPRRTTISSEPVAPSSPETMGDRTERYFTLVTEDPRAAHQMCAGSMANAGPEGIEQRYAGVHHVEVQQITIDGDQATTTSTVRIVYENGTETIERRQLTFTWGGDPKISDDSAAG